MDKNKLGYAREHLSDALKDIADAEQDIARAMDADGDIGDFGLLDSMIKVSKKIRDEQVRIGRMISSPDF